MAIRLVLPSVLVPLTGESPFAVLASHLDNLGDRVWMLFVGWHDVWCAPVCEIQSVPIGLGALGLTSAELSFWNRSLIQTVHFTICFLIWHQTGPCTFSPSLCLHTYAVVLALDLPPVQPWTR